MNKYNYVLDVLVNGRPVSEHTKDGKFFVEAREGTEYTLRFKNNTAKRVMAIFSVDGIDVLKGKVAEEADSGYIVAAYSLIEIRGYRIDDKTVAAFKFGSKGVSYAVTVGGTKTTKKGKEVQVKTDKNNGVIGVRIFEEDVPAPVPQTIIVKEYIPVKEYVPYPVYPVIRPYDYTYNPWYGSSKLSSTTHGDISFNCVNDIVAQNTSVNNAKPEAQPTDFKKLRDTTRGIAGASYGCYMNHVESAPNFDVGTQWGGKVADEVIEIPFKACDKYVDLEIYYATRQKLEECGIDFSHRKKVAVWPSAFAKEQYCKTPPGYKA